MTNYLIGDIHGCYISFTNLLNKISFNKKEDILWITGDLVAKGPHSLAILNLIYNIRNSVKIVLGNHDLNLLRIYSNINNKNKKKYTDNINIFQSSHSDKLINWLRHQPIMQINEEKKIIMTHAGIHPKWDIHTTKKFAKEIENILQNKNYSILLNHINTKKKITNNILNMTTQDLIKIQFNINTFTKMRYLLPNGELEMEYKDSPKKAPYSLKPWFNLPRATENYSIIFGHWSTLYGEKTPPKIYGLDSGCYRGGKLTSLRWEDKKLIHITCNNKYL